MRTIKNNLNKFITVKNSSDNKAELYFYGDIVHDYWSAWDDVDQYPEAIRDFLKDVEGKDLDIYVNSGGGSVFAGMAIYNMLKRHKGYKKTYIDGLAASISSVIALASDEVIANTGSYFMIHKAWTGVYGNSDELRETADVLEKLDEGILEVYSENLREGVDIETIKQFMKDEKWFTADEASQYFKIEKGESQASLAVATANKFKNMPKMESQSKKMEMKLKLLEMGGLNDE